MEKDCVFHPFGKTSTLRIVAGETEGQTYLKELSFTAPFKVMSPFSLSDGGIRIMPLLASAGILEGDWQEIHMETEPYAKMECVSQSYEKLHKMKNGSARRKTYLHAGRNSVLLYRPLPVIPFGQSAFDGFTEICLEDETSSMFYQEILSCGRAARGERFEYRHYNSLVEVRRCGELVYRENNRFHPSQDCMEECGMYEGYSCLASILFFHTNASDYIEEIRYLIDGQEGVCGGVTLTADLDMVARILGSHAQTLQQLCDKIYAAVKDETTLCDVSV